MRSYHFTAVFLIFAACKDTGVRDHKPSDENEGVEGYLEEVKAEVEREEKLIRIASSTITMPENTLNEKTSIRIRTLKNRPERNILAELGDSKGDIVEVVMYRGNKEVIPSGDVGKPWSLQQALKGVTNENELKYVVISSPWTKDEQINIVGKEDINIALALAANELNASIQLYLTHVIVYAVQTDTLPEGLSEVNAESLSNSGGTIVVTGDSGSTSSQLSPKDIVSCFVREDENGLQYYYLLTFSGGAWAESMIGAADKEYGDAVCNLLIALNGDMTVFNSASEWRLEHYAKPSTDSIWSHLGIDYIETIEQQPLGTSPVGIIGNDGVRIIGYVQYDGISPLPNGDHGRVSVWQGSQREDLQSITVPPYVHNPFHNPHLAQDSQGNIHFVVEFIYQDESKYSLRYAQYVNSWTSLQTIPSISSDGILDPYLMVGPQDNLYLFYRLDNGTTCDLRQVVRDKTSGSWQGDTKVLEFGPAGVCGGPNIELTMDPLGRFYIGYRKSVDGVGKLYLASFDGSNWTEEAVTTAAGQSVHSAINIVSDGLTVTMLYIDKTDPYNLILKDAAKNLSTGAWTSSLYIDDFTGGFARDTTHLRP